MGAVPPPKKIELDIHHGIKEYFYYTPHNNKSSNIHFNRNRNSIFKEIKTDETIFVGTYMSTYKEIDDVTSVSKVYPFLHTDTPTFVLVIISIRQ